MKGNGIQGQPTVGHISQHISTCIGVSNKIFFGYLIKADETFAETFFLPKF